MAEMKIKSVKQLAERAKVSYIHLHRVMKGTKGAGDDTINSLSAFFGCKPSDLTNDPSLKQAHQKLSDLNGGEARILEALEERLQADAEDRAVTDEERALLTGYRLHRIQKE